jgi:hypothetical protein
MNMLRDKYEGRRPAIEIAGYTYKVRPSADYDSKVFTADGTLQDKASPRRGTLQNVARDFNRRVSALHLPIYASNRGASAGVSAEYVFNRQTAAGESAEYSFVRWASPAAPIATPVATINLSRFPNLIVSSDVHAPH